LSLKVPRWFYRSLWISVAVLGAFCTTGFIPLLMGNFGDQLEENEKILFLAMALFGVAILGYAIWRLRWPLKAPPST
jgi:fucose permease